MTGFSGVFLGGGGVETLAAVNVANVLLDEFLLLAKWNFSQFCDVCRDLFFLLTNSALPSAIR